MTTKKKRVLKFMGIAALALVITLVVLVFIIVRSLDADMLEKVLESRLSRKVQIQTFKAGLFSAVSGIKAEQIVVSNMWESSRIRSELTIPEDEVFMRAGSFKFEFSILPLLKKQLKIQNLILQAPEIRLIQYADGSLNISDLMRPQQAAAEPMAAQDLPLSLHIDRIAVTNGTVMVEDRSTGNRFQVSELNVELFDIQIDPQDLENSNSLQTKIEFSVESLFVQPGGFAQKLNAVFKAGGTIHPFDPKTGEPSPSFNLRLESPSGLIQGSSLLKQINSLPLIEGYGLRFNLLDENLDWKEAVIDMSMQNNVLAIREGKFHTGEYDLLYHGSYNLASTELSADIELLLDPALNETAKSIIRKQAGAVIRADMKKYLSEEDVAQVLVSAMQNEKQQIQLPLEIFGSLSKPRVKLKGPRSDALTRAFTQLVADRAKSAGRNAVKENIKGAIKGLIKKK